MTVNISEKLINCNQTYCTIEHHCMFCKEKGYFSDSDRKTQFEVLNRLNSSMEDSEAASSQLALIRHRFSEDQRNIREQNRMLTVYSQIVRSMFSTNQ